MPKEKIHHSKPQDGVGPSFHMEVGWQRDVDVQVGIATDNGPEGQYSIVDAVYGDPVTLAAIGQELVDRLAAKGITPTWPLDPQKLGGLVLDVVTGSTPFGTSVWVHPSRKEINDMIRLLRKARDAAYGRDE